MKDMLTGQALELVLNMAKERCGIHLQDVSTTELEAIEEVDFLLTQFEDTGSHTEEDYMDD